MRDQEIRVGASYVNKSGRAERLVLDRGPHLVGCGVWAGAEPDDPNHEGEDGVLYIETRLGNTRYGAGSGRRPIARYVGAFAAWARKEVPPGQDASEYTNEDMIALREAALSSVSSPKTVDWEVVWLSHDGQRIALVSHPSGFQASREVLEMAAKHGRGSGKVPTQIFLVGPACGEGEVTIREIIGDGAAGLRLSSEICAIPAYFVNRRPR